MRAQAITALGLLIVASCGDDGRAILHDTSAPCAVTLCMNGAGGRSHRGNQAVDELCAELPGVLWVCDEEPCWPSFRSADGARAATAFSTALQTVDETCPASVVGYSWGGVNAVDTARQILDQGGRVDRLVLIDPFAPGVPAPLDVDDRVGAVWVYRHSVAPADDCSRNRPLVGPYLGLPARCGPETRCLDYDFSTSPELADVAGHCVVAELAVGAARINVAAGTDAPPEGLPPPVEGEKRSSATTD